MGPNRRAQERERAAARAAEAAKRAEAERKAAIEARKIVEIWERAPGLRGSPCGSIRRSAAAISAGFPWLTFFCPACRVVGSVDLRTLDRPPGRIDLKPDPIPVLSKPFAKLEMLSAERP
jgi:hypothetical protein